MLNSESFIWKQLEDVTLDFQTFKENKTKQTNNRPKKYFIFCVLWLYWTHSPRDQLAASGNHWLLGKIVCS